VELCRDRPFFVEVSYNSLVGSAEVGVDVLRKTTREYVEPNEGFRIDIHVQEVAVVEYDKWNNPSESVTKLQIEKEPKIITSPLPKGYD
jgi:poly-beta-hydroxyalkanoate depolymerase